MTTAVCDAGPLTHLWQIDLWTAFGTFDEIHLANQVALEVHEHVPLDQLERLVSCAVQKHEIPQHMLEPSQRSLPADLTLEEADLATLALAQQTSPNLLLTDDLTLRRAADALEPDRLASRKGWVTCG
jgi:predicted nucleic acid-binding protein